MRRGSAGQPGHGERFWSAVALAAMGACSLTTDIAWWTQALCWAAIAVGAAAAVHFARRYLASRSARS